MDRAALDPNACKRCVCRAFCSTTDMTKADFHLMMAKEAVDKIAASTCMSQCQNPDQTVFKGLAATLIRRRAALRQRRQLALRSVFREA